MCPLRGNDLAHLRRQSQTKSTKAAACSEEVSGTCARCHNLKVRKDGTGGKWVMEGPTREDEGGMYVTVT